jgi:hypothetical protein
MNLTRRCVLRALLLSPLALLGLRLDVSAGECNAATTAACVLCDHYVLLEPYGLEADGPASAHCRHLSYCGDSYLYEELISELNLYRRPDDKCDLFSLRRGLQRRIV